jgi:hypothetical protein
MRTVPVKTRTEERKDREDLASRSPSHYYRLKTITRTLPAETRMYRAFSNSRLEGISECPTWGIVHMQRQYPQHGRALALEAGETMHQFFAAMRIWQLAVLQKLPDHAMNAGTRIFTEDKWKGIWKMAAKGPTYLDQIGTLATEVIQSSGYYDDPKDTTRTLSNMQTAAMVYARTTLDHLDNWPIWVDNPKDANKPVGIEQIFDVMLEYEDGKRIRYIGTIDGILTNKLKSHRVTMAENKTAQRMDRAWVESFKMRHQITSYIACGQALFGIDMWHTRVYGCLIKPMFKGTDVHIEPVTRDGQSIYHWANWARKQVELFEEYEDDWEHAERRTHSCMRFFRPCALIPFCGDTPSGRTKQYVEMIPATPSPSERAVQV